MFVSKRLPRALLAATLVVALAALPVPRAQAGPSPADSPMGVVFAVFCGAGINITRMAPGVPIVVAVTAVACLGMFLDGAASPDP